MNNSNVEKEKAVFSIKLRYWFVPILKALGNVTPPHYMSRISRLSNTPEHICRLRLKQLYEQGWEFTIYVDENKLRLRRLIIVLKRKPEKIVRYFLRSVNRILPDAKYMISYYLPITYDEYDLVRYYGDLVEKYYVMKGYERLRPDLMLMYFDGSNEEIRVGYDELVRVLNREYSGKPVSLSVKKSSFSGIDLMILKELQRKPFTSPTELGKKIGLPSVKVLRRLKNLVRDGVIGAFRVTRVPTQQEFIGVVIVDGLKVTLELIENLVSIPFVINVGYSEDVVAIGVRLSRLGISVLGDVVEHIGDKYDVRVYLMDPVVKAVYTIPYRYEYSKYRADWVTAVSEREYG